jgi:hypothetical protein
LDIKIAVIRNMRTLSSGPVIQKGRREGLDAGEVYIGSLMLEIRDLPR